MSKYQVPNEMPVYRSHPTALIDELIEQQAEIISQTQKEILAGKDINFENTRTYIEWLGKLCELRSRLEKPFSPYGIIAEGVAHESPAADRLKKMLGIQKGDCSNEQP